MSTMAEQTRHPSGATEALDEREGCLASSCSSPRFCRGYCTLHYQRLRKFGDAEHDPRDPQRRFWAKVDKAAPGGCWSWTGALNNQGYGIFNLGAGKLDTAHRVAYSWLVGPIPAGLELDHLCKVRSCCNPSHLEPVTHAENSRRASLIGHPHPNARTGCAKGHDWSKTPPIVKHLPNGEVRRECRVCDRLARQSRRAAAVA